MLPLTHNPDTQSCSRFVCQFLRRKPKDYLHITATHLDFNYSVKLQQPMMVFDYNRLNHDNLFDQLKNCQNWLSSAETQQPVDRMQHKAEGALHSVFCAEAS